MRKFKTDRNILLGEINGYYKELLKAIEYHYYTKININTKFEA